MVDAADSVFNKQKVYREWRNHRELVHVHTVYVSLAHPLFGTSPCILVLYSSLIIVCGLTQSALQGTGAYPGFSEGVS